MVMHYKYINFVSIILYFDRGQSVYPQNSLVKELNMSVQMILRHCLMVQILTRFICFN